MPNHSHIQADLASAMLRGVTDASHPSRLVASLDDSEVREYLLAAIAMTSHIVRIEQRVLLDNDLHREGPAMALLLQAMTAERKG